jgi:hypothetical protein
MCHFCGCSDCSDQNEDLPEIAEYGVKLAYLEQANRDNQAEQ